jgi:paraquat-inducible protein A
MMRPHAEVRARIQPELRECPGCGLLQTVPPLSRGMTAVCTRCHTRLHRATGHALESSIAITLAALILLLITSVTAMLSVSTAGIDLSAGLLSGPEELMRRGMSSLAMVVVFVTLIAPFGKLIFTLYVLIRAHERQPPAHLRRVFVWAEKLRPWSMIEVFVFGVFVAYTKLADLVTLRLDVGVYALLALTIAIIWADSGLHHEAVWRKIGGKAPEVAPGTPGAVGCETCGMVGVPHGEHAQCQRCESPLHRRKPNSISRTWALVIAAAVLYVPANLYPVLTVVQMGAGAPSTILGGVEELFAAGLYPLAALVFLASIAVPMLKLVGLTFLLIMAQAGRPEWLRDRTRLYYIVRFVGRWSMIDIFMESLLGALVRFGALVTIEPGFGAVAFCAVVILTMIAAETFDPRLMWDAAVSRRGREAGGTFDHSPASPERDAGYA